MKPSHVLLCAAVLFAAAACAQRGTGEIVDPALIAKTPRKIALSERSYRGMPTAVSLEAWCPTPGDQGEYGTCAAWATGYGVATILYAKTHNITDKALINKYAFSPSHLYERIKAESDANCQGGSSSINALITLMETGDARLSTVPYTCGAKIDLDAQLEAMDYRIKDATILFTNKGIFKNDELYREPDVMIDLTKKAIAEGSPVAISFSLPKSFFAIKTAVWSPDPNEAMQDWKHNSHAMAVIGYDDNVAGGAFRVLNSWGTGWADGGKVWIRYADFTRWIKMAMQAFANTDSKPPAEIVTPPAPQPAPTPQPAPPTPVPQPAPVPTPVPQMASMQGRIEFKLNSGEDMPVQRISSRNLVVEEDKAQKEDMVAYTMQQAYTSGTRFQFYLTTGTEAYIYAFATDLTGKINRILPFDDLTSTHVGSNSTIAFPSDTKVIKLDDNKGTDYLLVLYSTEKLDVAQLMQKLEAASGGLSAKIAAALGNQLVDKSAIRYEGTRAAFSVGVTKGSRNLTVENDAPSGGTIVPVMVEIKHQ